MLRKIQLWNELLCTLFGLSGRGRGCVSFIAVTESLGRGGRGLPGRIRTGVRGRTPGGHVSS